MDQPLTLSNLDASEVDLAPTADVVFDAGVAFGYVGDRLAWMMPVNLYRHLMATDRT